VCYDLNMCSSCPDTTLDSIMPVMMRLVTLLYMVMFCQVVDVLLGVVLVLL